MGKKRIIKKFEQLTEELVEQLRLRYPDGFEDHVITFSNPRGEIEVAIPFETEDISYLIKMPKHSYSNEEDDFDSPSSFGGFDNFENLDIADEVSDDDDDDIPDTADDGGGDDDDDDED